MLGKTNVSRMVVENRDKQKRVISNVHSSNHLGVHRTNHLVSKKYYWPGIYMCICECYYGPLACVIFETPSSLIIHLVHFVVNIKHGSIKMQFASSVLFSYTLLHWNV